MAGDKQSRRGGAGSRRTSKERPPRQARGTPDRQKRRERDDDADAARSGSCEMETQRQWWLSGTD